MIAKHAYASKILLTACLSLFNLAPGFSQQLPEGHQGISGPTPEPSIIDERIFTSGRTERHPTLTPTTTSANEQISLLERAAVLSEKSDPKNAAGYFLKLADAEASANFLEKAISHCRKAIELYQGSTPGRWSGAPCLPTLSTTMHMLASHGRNADCINLFRTAIDKVKSVNGARSPEAAEQLIQLLEFYRESQQNKEAMVVLDEILACDVKQFYLSHQQFDRSHGPSDPVDMEAIYTWAKAASADGKREMGLEILNKILAAQHKVFLKDDQHIARTLVNLGDLHSMAHDTKTAESNYHQAFEIYKLYGSEKDATRRVNGYVAILRKNSKSAEADRLDALEKEPYVRPQPEKEKVDSNGRPIVDIVALQKQYADSCKEAPYSDATAYILLRLIQAAQRKQDRALEIQYRKEQITLLNHNGSAASVTEGKKNLIDTYLKSAVAVNEDQKTLVNANLQSGDLTKAKFALQALISADPKADENFDLQRKFVEACIKQNRLVEAQAWVRRPAIQNADPQSLGVLWNLLKMENACGDKKKAVAILEKFETLSKTDPSVKDNKNLPQMLGALWKEVGNEERSKKYMDQFYQTLRSGRKN